MGCPIHVWAPMMAAMAPVARVARMRLQAALDERRGRDGAGEPPRELNRWAPIQPHTDRRPDPAAE